MPAGSTSVNSAPGLSACATSPSLLSTMLYVIAPSGAKSPAGITHVASNASAGTASFAAGTVSWNGAIAAGASVTITIQATVDADATGTIANQGTVQYDADNDGSNETSALSDDPGEAGTGNPTGFEVDEGTVEPPPTAMPAVIPANGLLSLFALTLLLLGIAWRRRIG